MARRNILTSLRLKAPVNRTLLGCPTGHQGPGELGLSGKYPWGLQPCVCVCTLERLHTSPDPVPEITRGSLRVLWPLQVRCPCPGTLLLRRELVSAFGTPQVVPGAWVDAALRSPPVSGMQKVRRAGTQRSTLEPPHLSFSFGEGAKLAQLYQRSWPDIVSATQLLVKVLDWGAFCPSSTTDSPSCCQPLLGPPE